MPGNYRDAGDPDNIEPIDKVQVGDRLAFCVLAHSNGQTIPCSGRTLAATEKMPGAMKIQFDHTDGDLMVKGDKPAEFSLAGADHKWHWVAARIEGDAIIVLSPSAPNPVAVRYAWQSLPVAMLYKGAGLPAVPFRTGDWPGVTFGKTIH